MDCCNNGNGDDDNIIAHQGSLKTKNNSYYARGKWVLEYDNETRGSHSISVCSTVLFVPVQYTWDYSKAKRSRTTHRDYLNFKKEREIFLQEI